METTNFDDVLREAAAEAGVDAENPSAVDFLNWRRFATKRLDVAWRHHTWPDLGRCEQRWYRLPYNAASTYAAATAGADSSASEVYWPLTAQYYVALTAVPINTPPSDANGVTDLAHWAITAQFTLTPALPGPVDYYNQPVASVSSYSPTQTYNQGDRVSYAGNVYQLFVATATGVLPTVTTSWGLVPPFDAYVPYEQGGQTAFTVVEECFSANPKTTTRGSPIDYFLSERGVQVLTKIGYAWVQYRIRSPKLNGAVYSSTATYAAGSQVYYSSAVTPGNFYNVVTTTTAGQTPDTNAAKFAVVPLPRIFHRYLVLGMAADWAKYIVGTNPEAEAQTTLLQGLAKEELDDVKSLYVGQMGQRQKTQVATR